MRLGFWSLPAVVVAGQLFVQLQQAGREPSWLALLLIQLLRWWPWALVTPWLQRQARGHGGATPARTAATLTASALLLLPASAAWGLFVDLTLFQGIRMDAATWLSRIAGGSLVALPVFLVVFGGILGFTWGMDLYTEYQRRQVESERLRSDLAEARLQALQLQLQPHFLFNTLHTITALMEEDTERAGRMTARLGGLLRATLEVSEEPFVTLRREVRLAELYLEIERARFEDRLRVRWQIAPDTLEAMIPTLTLQPLVENAVRHGVGARAGEGTVTVVGRRQGDELRVEVRDDGVGPPEQIRLGVGIRSVETRLSERFGSRAEFTLAAAPGGGCVASVRLPFEVPCAS